MITALIIITAVLIIIPLVLWSWMKAIKKTRGYQIWFKKVKIISFSLCYLLALACIITIVLISIL